MLPKDPYQILGVSRTAKEEEIKKAYYEKVLKYHPDQNPHDYQASKVFEDIQEAYKILSDPQQRKNYDTFGQRENSYKSEEPPFHRNPKKEEPSNKRSNEKREHQNYYQYKNNFYQNQDNSPNNKKYQEEKEPLSNAVYIAIFIMVALGLFFLGL